MNKYAPLTLRTIAAITSATSAAAAYPAAANLFGMFPGGVMVASSAAAIYAGWHIVATSEDTDHRIVSGVTAALFAVGMVAGIHNSADLKESAASHSTAIEADTLYQNQESTRMATLATVAAELRATQKSKYPAEYERLQAQMQTLTTPTARTVTATQAATFESSGVYRWALSSVFEIVTPALLLLAGMFTRQLPVNSRQLPVNSVSTQEKQPLIESALTPQLTALTPVNSEVDEVLTASTAPLTALTRRQIEPSTEGYVTASAVVSITGCTDRQARQALKDATDENILERTGEGNATRYQYSNKLRVIK